MKRNRARKEFILRLYVSGATSQSTLAIVNIKKICDDHLHGRYALEVIDIYQELELAKRDEVIAVPTLIKRCPVPLRRLIGDMSNTERVLDGLGIRGHQMPGIEP